MRLVKQGYTFYKLMGAWYHRFKLSEGSEEITISSKNLPELIRVLDKINS